MYFKKSTQIYFGIFNFLCINFFKNCKRLWEKEIRSLYIEWVVERRGSESLSITYKISNVNSYYAHQYVMWGPTICMNHNCWYKYFLQIRHIYNKTISYRWNERNLRVFKNLANSVHQLLDKVKTFSYQWMRMTDATLATNFHCWWSNPLLCLGID
jgi:hypothetical protein